MTLRTVILAAGQGKRMRSDMPKVLHPLAGKTLLEHVVTTAIKLNPNQEPLVVIGHLGNQVRDTLPQLPVSWVEQNEQLGTGHAVLQALPHIQSDQRILILCGDVPLISLQTLEHLQSSTPDNAIGIITAHFTDPTGFGRIVRDAQNKITRIIEEKDASDTERTINEVNTGIYLIPANYLMACLPRLNNNNAQKEYYLTDIISQAVQENKQIHSVHPTQVEETYGINDRIQLAYLERFYQHQRAILLMQQGVTLIDPQRFDLRGELITGKDVTIDINVIIEGNVTLGNRCRIGANCIIKNSIIADDVEIKANSIIEGAIIAEHCVIGPFARLRPETELASQVHIGNFVELKKSLVGQGSKINHLSYIGDSEIGIKVNIGAGTITCNYDGVNKHKTIIGDNAFIGSNSSLIAPITIGAGATIGAGSAVSKEAPANQLTLSRATQLSKDWQRPKKVEKES